MTTVAAETAPRHAFRDVWLISAGHMMTHWYPATFYLLLPLIGNELGLSFSQIGSILTCQFAAGALSNLPGGMVVDAIGRKGLLMTVALSWIGLPYLVMGFSHSYWMLLVCAARDDSAPATVSRSGATDCCPCRPGRRSTAASNTGG